MKVAYKVHIKMYFSVLFQNEIQKQMEKKDVNV